jgi:hypothetical protein
MTREQQIELVRKCLALTASPYPEEARTARRKAEALVRKFKITKAELRPPQPQRARCPGCPACRGGMVIRVDIRYATVNTTSDGTIWRC